MQNTLLTNNDVRKINPCSQLMLFVSLAVVSITIGGSLAFLFNHNKAPLTHQNNAQAELHDLHHCGGCISLPGVSRYSVCSTCYTDTGVPQTLTCDGRVLVKEVKNDGNKDVRDVALIQQECTDQMLGELSSSCTFILDDLREQWEETQYTKIFGPIQPIIEPVDPLIIDPTFPEQQMVGQDGHGLPPPQMVGQNGHGIGPPETWTDQAPASPAVEEAVPEVVLAKHAPGSYEVRYTCLHDRTLLRATRPATSEEQLFPFLSSIQVKCGKSKSLTSDGSWVMGKVCATDAEPITIECPDGQPGRDTRLAIFKIKKSPGRSTREQKKMYKNMAKHATTLCGEGDGTSCNFQFSDLYSPADPVDTPGTSYKISYICSY